MRVRAVRADISTRGWGFSVYTYARAHLEAISHVRALLLRITLFCRKKLIQLKNLEPNFKRRERVLKSSPFQGTFFEY